jgi:hypothetical protein
MTEARSEARIAVVNGVNRRVGLLLVAGIALLAIAIPVLAASPSAAPTKESNSEKPGKAAKGPETEVSLKGTVQKSVDQGGHPTYTLTADGKTWTLSAGPSWFWGDKNPLNAYVGKVVAVAGTTEAGAVEVDVETVDGTAIREPGKPPWAGGPWLVGPTHPGWKDWMANGKPGNGHGRENAPGQLKKASPTP